MTHDPVNHPDHYTSHPSGVECIEITRWLSFDVGNAVKYVWRAGLKEATEPAEDLGKARFYLLDMLGKLPSRNISPPPREAKHLLVRVITAESEQYGEDHPRVWFYRFIRDGMYPQALKELDEMLEDLGIGLEL
ncbi:hypothetical protein SEA_UPYO_31 [Gordonia phage Upyo]|nr:hypothetical protein SEA_UPYO_31 [Gordonia phage Upyo]